MLRLRLRNVPRRDLNMNMCVWMLPCGFSCWSPAVISSCVCMCYYHEALCGERIVLFLTENRLTLRLWRKQTETRWCPSKTEKYLDYKKVLLFCVFSLTCLLWLKTEATIRNLFVFICSNCLTAIKFYNVVYNEELSVLNMAP